MTWWHRFRAWVRWRWEWRRHMEAAQAEHCAALATLGARLSEQRDALLAVTDRLSESLYGVSDTLHACLGKHENRQRENHDGLLDRLDAVDAVLRQMGGGLRPAGKCDCGHVSVHRIVRETGSLCAACYTAQRRLTDPNFKME